jgi:DNA polymerase I-like protein with 3'-5' exonuclease and polymerase domains
MRESTAQIEKDGFSLSLLGRKFTMSEERTIKSAFNAQVQGTVAHAMQNTVYQVHQKFPENILTEVHDALILCSKAKDVPEIVRGVSEVMLHPLDGISNVDARFPLKISLGAKWKKWKTYKELR